MAGKRRGTGERISDGHVLLLPPSNECSGLPAQPQTAKSKHPSAPTCLPPIPPCLQAVASALLPKLEKTRSEVEELLFEVVTLEVGAACFSRCLVLAGFNFCCWLSRLLLSPGRLG